MARVVDDADELVVELGAREVGVVGGVVALAAEDGDELGSGLEEAAAFADGVEPAVEFEGSGAVAVAEESTMPCALRRVRRPPASRVGVSASTARVAVKYWSATTVSAMRA